MPSTTSNSLTKFYPIPPAHSSISIMQLKTLLISILPTLALAQGPGDPGFYNTVAEIYAGPDCSEDTFVWADPIFGRGGMCQLLDRNNNTPDIVSYKVISQYPGCSGKLPLTSMLEGKVTMVVWSGFVL